jgi:hypothetical protein
MQFLAKRKTLNPVVFRRKKMLKTGKKNSSPIFLALLIQG